MKKTLASLSLLVISLASNAQDNNFEPLKDRQFIFDIMNICAVLLVIYLLCNFILRLIKNSLDFKLKNKIIDKQTPEPVIGQLVQSETNQEKRKYLLQWFFVLAAIGVGFIIISLTVPFGLHSLAIMALSIATGLGGYYYFTRNAEQ
jgi:hypothetical protein